MAPRVSGYVTDNYVQDNDEVTAGHPLITMLARMASVHIGRPGSKPTTTIATSRAAR